MKFQMIKNKNKQNTKGFTIIETLVAIFVLLISTTGPLTFAQSALRSSFLARDQITAFYLAQDAIEVIKNFRDKNTLAHRVDSSLTTGWLDGLGGCKPSTVDVPVVCQIDTGLAAIHMETCPGGICSPLWYSSSTKQYVLSGTSGIGARVSKYTRTIYVTEIVENREAQITVEVSWTSNLLPSKRIVVQENIFKKY